MQNDLDRETAALQELESQKQDAQDRLEEMDQQKHKLEDMLNEIRMKCQEESQMVIKGDDRSVYQYILYNTPPNPSDLHMFTFTGKDVWDSVGSF